jgi:putative transposase
LRRREGDGIEVEIRVDESNLGALYVLSPRTSIPYLVPCLNIDYADGISLWQHRLFKRRQEQLFPTEPNACGYLQAKSDIQRMVDESVSKRRGKSGQRLGRYLESAQSAPVKRALSKVDRASPMEGVTRVESPAAAIEKRSNSDSEVDDLSGFTPIFRGPYVRD